MNAVRSVEFRRHRLFLAVVAFQKPASEPLPILRHFYQVAAIVFTEFWRSGEPQTCHREIEIAVGDIWSKSKHDFRATLQDEYNPTELNCPQANGFIPKLNDAVMTLLQFYDAKIRALFLAALAKCFQPGLRLVSYDVRHPSFLGRAGHAH